MDFGTAAVAAGHASFFDLHGLLLIFILLSLIVIRRVSLSLGRREVPWYTDPVVMFTGSWVLLVLCFSLPIIQSGDKLEFRHIAFITLCHACFLLGVSLVGPGKAKPALVEGFTMPPSILWGLALLGMLGSFAVTYDGFTTSTVGLLERFTAEGLQTVRVEKFANGMMMRGGSLASLESMAAASTVFICLLVAGAAERKDISSQQKVWFWLAALLSGVWVGFNALFVSGGRIGLILLLMGVAFASLLDKDRVLLRGISRRLGSMRKPVIILLVLAAMYGVWALAVTFSKARSGGESSSPLVALSQYHRAQPHPLIADSVDNEESGYALLSFSYLTVPLSTMIYYYDMGDHLFPGPYWGQYNFSSAAMFVMRRMGQVRKQKTLFEIRDEATLDLVTRGYGDNVWSTLLRDLALDVGWRGVPGVLFLIGLGSELVMRGARRDGNVVMKIVALLTSIFLIFSIAHSLFVLNSFQKAYGFCFALLIYMAVVKKLSPAKKRGQLETRHV